MLQSDSPTYGLPPLESDPHGEESYNIQSHKGNSPFSFSVFYNPRYSTWKSRDTNVHISAPELQSDSAPLPDSEPPRVLVSETPLRIVNAVAKHSVSTGPDSQDALTLVRGLVSGENTDPPLTTSVPHSSLSPTVTDAGGSPAGLLDNALEGATLLFPTQPPHQLNDQWFPPDLSPAEDTYFETSLRMLQNVLDRSKGHPVRTTLMAIGDLLAELSGANAVFARRLCRELFPNFTLSSTPDGEDISTFVGALFADTDVDIITDGLITFRQYSEEKIDLSMVGSFARAGALFALQSRYVGVDPDSPLAQQIFLNRVGIAAQAQTVIREHMLRDSFAPLAAPPGKRPMDWCLEDVVRFPPTLGKLIEIITRAKWDEPERFQPLIHYDLPFRAVFSATGKVPLTVAEADPAATTGHGPPIPFPTDASSRQAQVDLDTPPFVPQHECAPLDALPSEDVDQLLAILAEACPGCLTLGQLAYHSPSLCPKVDDVVSVLSARAGPGSRHRHGVASPRTLTAGSEQPSVLTYAKTAPRSSTCASAHNVRARKTSANSKVFGGRPHSHSRLRATRLSRRVLCGNANPPGGASPSGADPKPRLDTPPVSDACPSPDPPMRVASKSAEQRLPAPAVPVALAPHDPLRLGALDLADPRALAPPASRARSSVVPAPHSLPTPWSPSFRAAPRFFHRPSVLQLVAQVGTHMSPCSVTRQQFRPGQFPCPVFAIAPSVPHMPVREWHHYTARPRRDGLHSVPSHPPLRHGIGGYAPPCASQYRPPLHLGFLSPNASAPCPVPLRRVWVLREVYFVRGTTVPYSSLHPALRHRPAERDPGSPWSRA